MNDFNLELHVSNTVKAAVTNYLNNVDLEKLAVESLSEQINLAVTDVARRALGNILKSRDIENEIAAWLNNAVAEQLINTAKSALIGKANTLSLEKIAADVLTGLVSDKTLMMDFPPNSISPGSINWSRARIPASSITTGVITDFQSTGITDRSTESQVTVTNDGTIIKNLLVEETAFIDVLSTEKNLEVAGKLTLGPQATQTIKDIAAGVVTTTQQTDSIDLTGKTIVNQGKLVLSADTLGPSVMISNLRKVGNLTELTVSGDVSLSEVVLVSTSGKVGINTEEVPGAFTVWDQDSEFSLVKTKARHMFVGSTRNTGISLGTNNQEQIVLKTDGSLEFNGKIRWSGRLFSIANQVPEQTGEPGEIVIVNDDIYSCQGANRWKKIA